MVVAPSHESSISTLRVELDEPFPDVNLVVADELWVLATYHGVPVMHLRMPGPGRCGQPHAFLAATVGRAAAPHVAFERMQSRLARRLGTAPSPPPLTVSVVVCTHRRPEELARLLGALRELDPPPGEIIVVDNAPGEADARAVAAQAGAIYVRLDIKGLDRARAAGVDRATGDVVAFTDDDVVPSVGWLRNVDSLFADPLVGCVAGPVLPLELRTVAQRDHERIASLNRGLVARSEDWTSLDAAFAPELGVGANLLIRREALQSPEALFPAELDAGTPTESGGDGYALYRMVADGWRVVYDPATFVLHDHRSDPSAFRRAVRGYGIGLGSWTATVLGRDRDLGALALGLSPVKTLLLALAKRASGRADTVETAAARDLVVGLLLSPTRLRRSRRLTVDHAGLASGTSTAGDDAEPNGRAQVAGEPRAIAGSRSPIVSVVIVAGETGAHDSVVRSLGFPSRDVVETTRADAGESPSTVLARLRGEIVLFWRADLDPHGEVISAHVAAHRDAANVIAVGEVRPRPADSSLVTRLYAGRLAERAHHAGSAVAMPFVDIGDANISCRVELLREVVAVAEPRSVASLQDAVVAACLRGAEVRPVAATAARAVSATWADATGTARRRGERLGRLAAIHGDQAPLLRALCARHGRYTRSDRLLSDLRLQHRATLLLGLLESVRARRQWAQVAQAMLTASFRRGMSDAAARGDEIAGSLDVEIDADGPISLGVLAARPTALRLRGQPAGFVAPLSECDIDLAAQELTRGIDQEAWAPLIREAASGYEPDPGALPTLTVLVPVDPGALTQADSAEDRLEGSVGVTVQRLPCVPQSEAFWDAVDAAIRSAATELVAVLLPGRSWSEEWATEVRLALCASAIDVAAGIGLDPRWAPFPIQLLSELSDPRMTADMAAMDYIAVRRSRYVALEGFDASLRSAGLRAPLCHLLRRHLGGGGVLAWTVSPGIATTGREDNDGTPMAVYGAALGACARARDPHARGLLVVTFAGLLATVATRRSTRGALAATRELVRFGRGVAASRRARAGESSGDAQT